MRNSSGNSRPENINKIYSRLYKFYGPQGWWPGRSRFEIIVGAILTQNTAWTNVEKAIAALRGRGYLSSPAKLHRLRTEELSSLIRPAGYHNVKASRLKNFTGFLAADYGGSLDKLAKTDTVLLRKKLLEVNGIGPETCDSILLYAFAKPVFVVDAYTKRIFSRHGLFDETTSYEDVQDIFTANLPSDAAKFNEYHALIVKLAKDHCRKSPECKNCPIYGVKIVAKKVS
ncbi:MAG: endonuclease III domain-containing protein [Candidatus Omnitrophica bacterium]|nr:endonuclease III domain-containing protein [Candidatus Omnitrophota bacterium]